jgi:SAM-dependent methyltransferase
LHWFHALYEGRERFDSLEEELAYREAQRALTRVEASHMRDLLALRPGQMALELFCGNGRHSVSLASLGLKVVGMDLARSRVLFASHWARDERVSACFLVGDAAWLPFRGHVEAVLILGGSFSHVGRWDEDVRFLQKTRTLLRRGGRLLIDNPNPLRFWALRHPQEELPSPEELAWFDLPLSSSGGSGHVRYWGAGSISRMMREAGFVQVRALGDRQGGPCTGQSPRLISIGQAP